MPLSQRGLPYRFDLYYLIARNTLSLGMGVATHAEYIIPKKLELCQALIVTVL
jgi:hypothetical protein